VAAVADGHEEALAELWRGHGGAVYGLCRRLCGTQRGKELAQEVFVALWQQPRSYDSTRGSVRSYLLLHAHGLAVDLIRSNGARVAREGGRRASEGGAGNVEQEALSRLPGGAAWEATSVLAAPVRQAIVLAFFDGLTYRQVAVELLRPEGTVKSDMRAGLAQLRGAMAAQGQYEGSL
jgi:RNA polymerase sigma-70 factor, ECF subfamily